MERYRLAKAECDKCLTPEVTKNTDKNVNLE